MKKSTPSSEVQPAAETKSNQIVQPAAQRAGAYSSAATVLADSPRMTAQRKQLSGAFGSPAQLEKKKMPMQKKAEPGAVLQLAGPKKKPGQK